MLQVLNPVEPVVIFEMVGDVVEVTCGVVDVFGTIILGAQFRHWNSGGSKEQGCVDVDIHPSVVADDAGIEGFASAPAYSRHQFWV